MYSYFRELYHKIMLSKMKIVLTIAGFFMFFLLIYLVLNNHKQVVRQNYTVNREALFSHFEMTVESGKQIHKENVRFKIINDSLIQAYKNDSDVKSRELTYGRLAILKNDIEQFNASFRDSENNRIWKRLQSYVADFEKLKRVRVHLDGVAKGDAAASMEIEGTKEIIDYVNKRYEGNN